MRHAMIAAVMAELIGWPAGTMARHIPSGVTDSYPRQAEAILALRRWFATDAAKTYPAAPPKIVHDDAPLGCDDSCVQRWQAVAETPRFLSLSRWTSEAGGAHPLSWSASMVWDKEAAVPRPTLSFFASEAALDKAVRPAFCRQLAAERRTKRGSFEGGDFTPWNDCVDPANTTIMLGSAKGRRFDRIGFRMDPYLAGPYAEGVYEVTLPVNPTILAAVKPEWRRYFAVAGTP